MEEPTSVRPATLNDIPWLKAELREFSSFFETKYNLFGDEVYIHSALEHVIDNELFLIAHSYEPQGFIVGALSPHPFNPNITVLTEVLWWVTPKHRGTRAGALLLKNYIDYGKRRANWVTFTLEDKSPVKEETLLKRGFRLKEKVYLMEVT